MGGLVRNAMICVSVMLALFLGWPLLFGENGLQFGGGASASAASVVARVAVPAPDPAPSLVSAGFSSLPVADARHPESCSRRYVRERALCRNSGDRATCMEKASDGLDMCEATGVWRD